VAQGEIGIDPRLQGSHPSLLEAGDLGLGEVLIPEVRKGGPTPEPKRLAQQPRGARCGPVGQALPTVRSELLKARGVDLVSLARNRVAASRGDDDLGAECLPKLPDIDPHRLRAGRRGVASPEFLSKPLDRNRLATPQKQQSKKRALLGSAKCDVAIPVNNLERPKE
jgi:hypothetical protein